MNARPLLVGLTLATAALPFVATAAPVTQSRLAVADGRIGLAHGHYVELSLRLTSADGAERLRVETRQCAAEGCGEWEFFSGPVSGAEVSASAAQARLRTVLDGVPVSVTWSPATTNALVLGGTELDGNDRGNTVSTYKGDSAVAKIALGDGTCSAEGAVGDEVRVSDSDTDAAAPLSELELPVGALTC